MNGSEVTNLFESLGAAAGVLALAWQFINALGSYVTIAAEAAEPAKGWVGVKTTIENRGSQSKIVSYALLLIGPEGEDVLTTARILAGDAGYTGPLRVTNDLEDFVVREPVIRKERAIVPLKYYYEENIQIADETCTYRYPLPLEQFVVGKPYSVRFFIFGPDRLHRSTQDSFIARTPE